ncbi:MAG: hypothetical protein N4A64_05830 [Marinisporobacter sp.]|jgi:hypothetical protein|nr:hypothetical protein [Marinisporobacter sp.]
MNILKDIYETNKEISKKAIDLTMKNWVIVFTGIIYSIISIVLFRVSFLFSILAGIIITLVMSALLSNYLYLIENIISYGKISLDDFKKGFQVYIWKIYGVMVVIWFVNYGADLFLSPLLKLRIGFVTLWMVLYWMAFVLLNCLPEVIYQKHEDLRDLFQYSFSFIKENWIDWFVPNIFLGVLFYLVMGRSFTISYLMTSLSLSLSIKSMVFYFIGQFLLSFTMVYRGLLFNLLSRTTRKKRVFKRNIYR